ncbi:MAG: hypothetical protein DRP74_05160 [Candidatus Omnitrophota bacterium]|nr:MAG: hypothetical protein DRP74_05160 [Candidatus Omnitrophota bacterium]
MPNKLKINNFIFLFLAIFFVCGCVTIYNPATESRETLLIDTASEVSLGEDMDKQLKRELDILDDPAKEKRLNSIGAKIAEVSDRQDLKYYFRIVNDEELNAFAIPGGFVYINKGLMNKATNAELACVVAHEIGHIAARHSVKRLQAVLGYQIITTLAFGLAGNSTIAQAVDVVFTVVTLGYSRKDEFLADRLAVKYAHKAGFNPYAMVSFFEKLKEEAQKKGPDSNLVFLSSHPPINERIKAVNKEIAQFK